GSARSPPSAQARPPPGLEILLERSSCNPADSERGLPRTAGVTGPAKASGVSGFCARAFAGFTHCQPASLVVGWNVKQCQVAEVNERKGKNYERELCSVLASGQDRFVGRIARGFDG